MDTSWVHRWARATETASETPLYHGRIVDTQWIHRGYDVDTYWIPTGNLGAHVCAGRALGATWTWAHLDTPKIQPVRTMRRITETQHPLETHWVNSEMRDGTGPPGPATWI
jgi:hypothetical protein